MDLITILALVLFAGMIVSWLVLPGAIATTVPTTESEAAGLPAAQPNV